MTIKILLIATALLTAVSVAAAPLPSTLPRDAGATVERISDGVYSIIHQDATMAHNLGS